MLKAFVYSVLVVLTIVFLWFTPQPAWTQNSQIYSFLDIGFKLIILMGVADCGFKCLSNKAWAGIYVPGQKLCSWAYSNKSVGRMLHSL